MFATQRQTTAAEEMQKAAEIQGNVAAEMLKVAREEADFAKRALAENKKMVRYTFWVAVGTGAVALITLLSQVVLICLTAKKN